jgi:hypothetical protein
MANAHAAPEVDRLPWLNDDVPPASSGERWLMLGLGFSTTVLVAAGSYWFGMNGLTLPDWRAVFAGEQSQVVEEPPPRVIEPIIVDELPPQPQVDPTPAPPPVVLPSTPEVRSTPEIERPRPVVRRAPPQSLRTVSRDEPAPKKAAEEKRTLQFSNPWESSGASGRMVRVGTYSSLEQGKQAWARLARVYPGMKRLPAVVTDIPSLRNGRVYYRLQIGTTSQAHSEVLCQRMKFIGQSCVVVDLSTAQARALAQRQALAQKQLAAHKSESQSEGRGPDEDERDPIGL